MGNAGLGRPQLREHPRVEQPGDVEVGVGIAAQLDDGRDVVGIEEHRHLRLGVVDGGQHLGGRLDERLVGLGVDLVDDLEVLVEQHDPGQPADRRLHRKELMELVARLVEQRLGARELNGDGDGIAAHELHVLSHISVGDDERILDQRVGLLREQPVEAPIEGDARHHRHQDRRHCCDDGEERHDPHMQPRCGAAAPSRLHNAPDLAADDQHQEEHGERIGRQERAHHGIGRRDRREVGEHHESDERRQQRDCDCAHPQRAGDPARRRRRPSACQFGRRGLTDVRHSTCLAPTGTPRRTRTRAVGRPPLINVLLFTDAFLQQCCQIATIPGHPVTTCG